MSFTRSRAQRFKFKNRILQFESQIKKVSKCSHFGRIRVRGQTHRTRAATPRPLSTIIFNVLIKKCNIPFIVFCSWTSWGPFKTNLTLTENLLHLRKKKINKKNIKELLRTTYLIEKYATILTKILKLCGKMIEQYTIKMIH